MPTLRPALILAALCLASCATTPPPTPTPAAHERPQTQSPQSPSPCRLVALRPDNVGYLNCGKRNGVRLGMPGKLCNRHRFTVIKVFPTRSKIRFKSPAAKLKECRTATLMN